MSPPAGPLPIVGESQPPDLAAIWGPAFTGAAVGAAVGGGFSGASVRPVVAGHGRFALRGWPADGPPAARIAAIHTLTRHLAHTGGLPLAVPLPVVVGQGGGTLAHAAGRLWQLEPWLPGEPQRGVIPDARLCAAAAVLARWHVAAGSFAPSAAARPWLAPPSVGVGAAAGERAERLRAVLDHPPAPPVAGDEGADLCRRTVESLRTHGPAILTELTACRSLRVPRLPVSRDVHRAHLLFGTDPATGRDAVTGWIDLSAARTDTAATDLARLLGDLLGDDRPRWDAALAAYRAVRPLSAVEERLVRVLDRSGVLLSAVGWVRRGDRRGAERLRGFVERMRAW